MLFADLRGYTQLVHDRGPVAMRPIVDDFFRHCREIVVRHDGIVDHFLGDAVLALFNAPVRHEDHAHRAVEAARAAVQSPLLDVSIEGATGVLFNVTGARNMSLHELHSAAQVISEVVAPDAEIIFGTAIDPSLGEEVKVTVIATGFPVVTRPLDRAEIEQNERFPVESLPNAVDTELPAFLRRTVALHRDDRVDCDPWCHGKRRKCLKKGIPGRHVVDAGGNALEAAHQLAILIQRHEIDRRTREVTGQLDETRHPAGRLETREP